MIHPGIRSFGEKLLPRFVLDCLDPIGRIIEAEVEDASGHTDDGQLTLDAGAGECRHKGHFRRGSYVAVDAATGDASWDYSRLDIIGDLERLPLKTSVVDNLLCMVVLEHTRRPRAVLAEFGRVLKAGGRLYLVVPFLWEEHQAPHDYHRFTRHGVNLLFEGLPFRLELVRPMGGFFWLCGRRCVNLLGFFQGGWRWIPFVVLAPFFGFLFPLLLYFLDGLDSRKEFSLGYCIRAVKKSG